jgi:hypothetical protein
LTEIQVKIIKVESFGAYLIRRQTLSVGCQFFLCNLPKKLNVPCYLTSKERGAATVFVAEIRAISTSILHSKMHAVSSGEVHIGLTTTPSNSDVCFWAAKSEERSVHVVFKSAAKRPVLGGVIPWVCDQLLNKREASISVVNFYSLLPTALKTLFCLRR